MKPWNNNFDRDFERMQRTHRIMTRVVLGFIAVVFVLILCWWGFIGYVAVTAGSEIGEHGLKAVIERIWCGAGKTCL